VEYTLADIQKAFPKVEVVAAMQCAPKDVKGVLWPEATIANVRWGGVRLRDLLLAGELSAAPDKAGTTYVCFASHIGDEFFGASVPLEKALSEHGDALLAYEMNGKPLWPLHGFPFRMVIPGYTGTRWIKWVNQITVSHRELQPDEQAEQYWSKFPHIPANPLNSVVGFVKAFDGALHVKGYAVGAPEGQVQGVSVSIDRGATWHPAKITYQEGRWSWTLWEAVIPLPSGNFHGWVYSRAEYAAGYSPIEDTDWLQRGVAYPSQD